MLPGQRSSRRMQALESQAFNPAGIDDGYDDFGIPNSAGDKKGRGSVSTKRSGLFGRKKRGTASSTAVDAYDNDSDDDIGGFAVLPGAPSPARPDMAGMGQQAMYGPNGGVVGGQLPQPGDLAHPGNLNHGDISMDQLTSIKDRHRYPTMEGGDVNGPRAMSLTSMSNYDTTPIIPMLGPLNNFQSGSSHNKSSQQEKYRQRMIESRRALMSSESGIPLSGNPTAQQHGPEAYDVPRTMSMGSMNSQMTSGSAPGGFARMGPPPGGRSNTMGSVGGPMGGPMPGHAMPGHPTQGPPMQGYPMQGQPGQPMGPGPHYQRPPYGGPPHPSNGQWMRPGAPGHGSGGFNPNNNPNLMPPPGQGGPMGYQGRNSGNSYPQQGPYPQQQHAQPYANQRGLHPGSAQESTMAPPMVTPHIGATSPADPGFSPGDASEAVPSQFSRGTHPPQVGLQRNNSNDDDLDFGPLPPSPPASSQKAISEKRSMNETAEEPTSENDIDTHEPEQNEEVLSSLRNDVRVLTIALAESTRRELDLAKSKDSKDAPSEITTAESLANLYSELSLERAKREAAEQAAKRKGSSPELHEKLAELDYRHSEATHLLSIRTEQYNALTHNHAMLKEDFTKKQEEMKEITSKSKKAEVSERLYKQDQQLKSEVDTLKHENSQLREQLDQLTSRGPLGSRISALEDQRSALQEALRAMRERKDTEIRALNNRIEMLTLSQQRRTTSSSSAASGSGTPAPRLASEGHGSTPSLFRPGLKTAALGQGEEGQLSLPRIRHSTLSRPASPLHLGLDYNR